MQFDELRLLGIPRWCVKIAKRKPHHDRHLKDYPVLPDKEMALRPKLVEPISVARVRPRTSKGITDLLLPQTSMA